MSRRARAAQPADEACGISPADVLEWLEAVRRAVARRDPGAVERLLARREAGVVSRVVREEALSLARHSPQSFRAPVALLRLAYQVQRLAESGEGLPGALGAAGEGGRGVAGGADGPAQLELPWSRSASPPPVTAQDRPMAGRAKLRSSLARGAAALHRCVLDRPGTDRPAAGGTDATDAVGSTGRRAARRPHTEPGARMGQWTGGGAGDTTMAGTLDAGPAVATAAVTRPPDLDPDLRPAAEAALDEHWALHSLRRARRDEIMAAAEARHVELTRRSGLPLADPTGSAMGQPMGESMSVPVSEPRAAPALPAAAAGVPAAGPARRSRGRGPITPPPSRVTDADVVHLAGAYDLAGRDAIIRLEGRARAGVPEPADDDPRPTTRLELALAANRAYVLQAVLPIQGAAGAARGGAPDAARGEDEGVLHRLLLLAALAEVGHRRADWLRWLEQRTPELATRATLAPVVAPASVGATSLHRWDTAGATEATDATDDAASPGTPVAMPWDLRCRSLVVAVWMEVLRRSGPSGLDDAMALLARLREEREAAEGPWLAAVEQAGGEVAAARANFTLFALGHLADAAVDTLLYLRHGSAHVDRRTLERTLRLRLNLAREAAAGDLQWDGLLAWLGEAARLVIARRTPQLEIAGAW